jgi:2-polyprenyl-3-methyl-5-hydroxy-6-metoxy-1,4-benzoquinol methylase
MAAATVDLDDLNSPHTLAVLSIPPGAMVLDVGCGTGIVARALAARGCKVWGVEIDPRRAASARTWCHEVLEVDVETVALSTELAGMKFDTVLFLDVLEHLRDPQVVLADAATVLAPGGSVLLSIPNVTHGALRLELLSGKFRYRASGLLDRGHLRFFDADGVDELIRQAGFHAETRLRVTRRLDQTEFDIDLTSIPSALRSTLESDPDALTYQFFVIARPVRRPHSLSVGRLLNGSGRMDDCGGLEKGSRCAGTGRAAKDVRLVTSKDCRQLERETRAAHSDETGAHAHLRKLAATTALVSPDALAGVQRQMEAEPAPDRG